MYFKLFQPAGLAEKNPEAQRKHCAVLPQKKILRKLFDLSKGSAVCELQAADPFTRGWEQQKREYGAFGKNKKAASQIMQSGLEI